MRNLEVNINKFESNEPIKVNLNGQLTAMSAIEFKKDILNIIAEERRDCIIDITSVDSVDITGMNALVMAHKSSIRNGNKVVLVCTDEHPSMELMHMAKFSNYFNLQRR